MLGIQIFEYHCGTTVIDLEYPHRTKIGHFAPLCSARQCLPVLPLARQCSTVLGSAPPCSAVLSSTQQCSAVLASAPPCSAVLNSAR